MSKTGRTIAIFLAFVACGVGICAACTDGFVNWNKYGWLGEDDAPHPDEGNGGDNQGNEESGDQEVNFSGVVNASGEELVSGEVYAMSQAMVYSLTSEESTTAKNGITIEAVITPSVAINKAVDFSVSFANAESEWAIGKVATDYVSVTPESDGATKATVYCLAPFAEQIIIEGRSRSKPEIFDTCTVDYAQRVLSVKLTIGDELSYDIQNEDAFDVDIDIGSSARGKGGELKFNYELSDTYTLAQDFADSVTFSHGTTPAGYTDSEYVAEKLVQGQYERFTEYDDPVLGSQFFLDRRLLSEFNFAYGNKVNNEITNFKLFGEETVDSLKTIFDNSAIQGKILWDVEVVIVGNYTTYVFEAKFVWASVSGWQDPAGITLGGNIIF